MKTITTFILSIFLAGCVTDRALDPAGAYGGDLALYNFDGVLLDFAEITENLLAVADRNPVAVAESENISKFVNEIRENRLDTIRRAKGARNLYIATKGIRGDLSSSQALMEMAIQYARSYLVALATQANKFETQIERQKA
jgi:hypothetical protein